MKPIDSENVIAWMNVQIEKVRGGWLHDYGFPTNVIVTLTDVKRFVKNLPTIEPEVRRGRWIELPKALNPEETPCKCSACGHILSFYGYYPKSNFCPHCGADMREEGTDNG